jgi:hypothetical protein
MMTAVEAKLKLQRAGRGSEEKLVESRPGDNKILE